MHSFFILKSTLHKKKGDAKARVESGFQINCEFPLDGEEWRPFTYDQNRASQVLKDQLDFWSWGIKA